MPRRERCDVFVPAQRDPVSIIGRARDEVDRAVLPRTGHLETAGAGISRQPCTNDDKTIRFLTQMCARFSPQQVATPW